MTRAERRFFQRFPRVIHFELETADRRMHAVSVNAGAGGAFIRTPLELPLGKRYLLRTVSGNQSERPVEIEVDAIHAHSPDGHRGHGMGVRWRQVRSELSEDAVGDFLESLLGIIAARIRHVRGAGGPSYWVYEFPEIPPARSAETGGLADLLEPARPGELSPPEPGLAPADADRASSGSGIQRVVRWFSGLTARRAEGVDAPPTSELPTDGADPEPTPAPVPAEPSVSVPTDSPKSPAPKRAVPERVPPRRLSDGSVVVQAPPRVHANPEDALKIRKRSREVPALPVTVRSTSTRVEARLGRLGVHSMDLQPVGPAPKLYERVWVVLPIPGEKGNVQVEITGMVTRIKPGVGFTVKYVRIDEGRNSGAFEDFVHSLTEDPE